MTITPRASNVCSPQYCKYFSCASKSGSAKRLKKQLRQRLKNLLCVPAITSLQIFAVLVPRRVTKDAQKQKHRAGHDDIRNSGAFCSSSTLLTELSLVRGVARYCSLRISVVFWTNCISYLWLYLREWMLEWSLIRSFAHRESSRTSVKRWEFHFQLLSCIKHDLVSSAGDRLSIVWMYRWPYLASVREMNKNTSRLWTVLFEIAKNVTFFPPGPIQYVERAEVSDIPFGRRRCPAFSWLEKDDGF